MPLLALYSKGFPNVLGFFSRLKRLYQENYIYIYFAALRLIVIKALSCILKLSCKAHFALLSGLCLKFILCFNKLILNFSGEGYPIQHGAWTCTSCNLGVENLIHIIKIDKTINENANNIFIHLINPLQKNLYRK